MSNSNQMGVTENVIMEIKRLLVRYEECMEKVEFNHNGTKITNPRQQGAANRFYNKAWKMAGDMDKYRRDFIQFHREVIDNRRKSF